MTGRAKAAIRRSLREEDKERFVRLGRELARVAFENVGKKATDKALQTAARALAMDDSDDMLARIGRPNSRPARRCAPSIPTCIRSAVKQWMPPAPWSA